MTDSRILGSYVQGAWHRAEDGFVAIHNPSTEEEIGRVSSRGVDFAEVLGHARGVGGPALRALTFTERGAILKALSRALRDHRDELLALSASSTGTTDGDGSFDIDGASGVFAYYAVQARKLGERTRIVDGAGAQLGKTEGFWAQHAWVSKQGAAVCINAFNFPAWGLAEKAACAWLAGVPVIAKPATSTALLTERMVEILLEQNVLPDGALQLICGSTGDLLDHLDAQDVLAFTGSADTALTLRSRPNLLECSTVVNVEADSLNAAVLAPGVDPASATFKLFIRDVAREMTQKSGQKCTAVRRILVPEDAADGVQEALSAKLARTVTGDPTADGVRMGPLANASQLQDAVAGVQELLAEAELVHGTGERADGVGAPEGAGFFFPPTLLRAKDPATAEVLHRREVFAPVATLMPYAGDAAEAAGLVARGGGMLVTSVYGDDGAWLDTFLAGAGAHCGRIYVGSEGSADVSFGSGAALPQTLHGGPGRAGGGEELGGLVGVTRYMQRVALQGDRSVVEGLAGVEADA
ncbi:MAG: 3,4-dehydroadipyl-CoA semialdehyde dehydrogenase [Acidobacteriota bacterium]